MIPAELVRPAWDDLARLEAWLGVDRPLWPRPARRISKTRPGRPSPREVHVDLVRSRAARGLDVRAAV